MSAPAKPLRRWEYMFLRVEDGRGQMETLAEGDVDLLNGAGADGWEVVMPTSKVERMHGVLMVCAGFLMKREVLS